MESCVTGNGDAESLDAAINRTDSSAVRGCICESWAALRDPKRQNRLVSFFDVHPEAEPVRQQRTEPFPHSRDAITPLVITERNTAD
jgi:hypothetical protein